MKYESFLIKYGEIGTKGKNRYVFEDALIKQIKWALRNVEGDFSISKEIGRIYVDCQGNYDEDEVIETLSHVFGIVAICPMVRVHDKDFENLKNAVAAFVDKVYKDKNITFKVDTKRADKSYPGTSETINAALGEHILNTYPQMKVDVRNPQVYIKVEIRNHVNIYSSSIKGLGGMPVGTNGRAMLLLSGGIDSPVAGYMIAKRGVRLEAVYFHAPPYTSERAKEKVITLAKLVSRYTGDINLHIINFTDIQLYIYDKCPHDELTIIMRRYMMKIAQIIAKEHDDKALITGVPEAERGGGAGGRRRPRRRALLPGRGIPRRARSAAPHERARLRDDHRPSGAGAHRRGGSGAAPPGGTGARGRGSDGARRRGAGRGRFASPRAGGRGGNRCPGAGPAARRPGAPGLPVGGPAGRARGHPSLARRGRQEHRGRRLSPGGGALLPRFAQRRRRCGLRSPGRSSRDRGARRQALSGRHRSALPS